LKFEILKYPFLLLSAAVMISPLAAQDEPLPRDSVPEDHLAWFGFRGPVAEVTEYDYYNYGKTVWRFDTQGRLIEYMEYMNPFTQAGGCVFGLYAHYRYAYDAEGKIQFLETYNADNNTVDAYADVILELFPPQRKEVDFKDRAEAEFGDTTFCFTQWHQKGEMSEYFGITYDRIGNWTEKVYTSEDGYSCAYVLVRDIRYYKDIELLNLPVGVRSVINHWTADDRKWRNLYVFDREGNLTTFRSKVDNEDLYEWNKGDEDVLGSDLISAADNLDSQEITYWDQSSVPHGELINLPEGCNEKTAFNLDFTYQGYQFEGLLYPLHNSWWIVLSYWCLDEMDGIFEGEDENGNPIPTASRYHDPFQGLRYPIIHTDSVSCSTRNYSNQTIKLYRKSEGKAVECKLKVQCNVDVLDADPETRRVFCRTNPNDWRWGEPANEEEAEWKHPFVSVIGWMDEEWVCANLLTTCP
jgi:hypothetical protein